MVSAFHVLFRKFACPKILNIFYFLLEALLIFHMKNLQQIWNWGLDWPHGYLIDQHLLLKKKVFLHYPVTFAINAWIFI